MTDYSASHIDKEHYAWYRDPRRHATVRPAGFGPGFERTLAYVTGVANVRDAIVFPRTPGNAALLARATRSICAATGRRRSRSSKR